MAENLDFCIIDRPTCLVVTADAVVVPATRGVDHVVVNLGWKLSWFDTFYECRRNAIESQD